MNHRKIAQESVRVLGFALGTAMLGCDVVQVDGGTGTPPPAIDAGTEHRIRSALKHYSRDRITIIIAHRLGSLMHADRILFLEAGRIVESGTHEELLALGGRYRALYDLQLRPAEAS